MKKSKYIRELTKIIILFILLISFQQLTLSNSLNNFKYIGPTIYNHSNANLTKLKDGKILIWGGTIRDQSIFKNHKSIKSMEVFDPKTNSFEYLGEIPDKYNFYNAIALDNGTVFFIGVSKFLGKSNTYGVIYKERNL